MSKTKEHVGVSLFLAEVYIALNEKEHLKSFYIEHLDYTFLVVANFYRGDTIFRKEFNTYDVETNPDRYIKEFKKALDGLVILPG